MSHRKLVWKREVLEDVQERITIGLHVKVDDLEQLGIQIRGGTTKEGAAWLALTALAHEVVVTTLLVVPKPACIVPVNMIESALDKDGVSKQSFVFESSYTDGD
jgi:hypothetical protein